MCQRYFVAFLHAARGQARAIGPAGAAMELPWHGGRGGGQAGPAGAGTLAAPGSSALRASDCARRPGRRGPLGVRPGLRWCRSCSSCPWHQFAPSRRSVVGMNIPSLACTGSPWNGLPVCLEWRPERACRVVLSTGLHSIPSRSGSSCHIAPGSCLQSIRTRSRVLAISRRQRYRLSSTRMAWPPRSPGASSGDPGRHTRSSRRDRSISPGTIYRPRWRHWETSTSSGSRYRNTVGCLGTLPAQKASRAGAGSRT